MWSGSEVEWSGNEVMWSGSEVMWSGNEVKWSGSEVMWSGSDATIVGGRDRVLIYVTSNTRRHRSRPAPIQHAMDGWFS